MSCWNISDFWRVSGPLRNLKNRAGDCNDTPTKPARSGECDLGKEASVKTLVGRRADSRIPAQRRSRCVGSQGEEFFVAITPYYLVPNFVPTSKLA